MDTDRFWEALPQQQSTLRRRPWYILAGVLLVVSALSRQPVVFFAAGFALVLGALPELWYHLALRQLVVFHSFNQPRAFFGEQVTLLIQLENRKWLLCGSARSLSRRHAGDVPLPTCPHCGCSTTNWRRSLPCS